MRSRWIAVFFVLLFIVFLIDVSRRLGAPLFDPQFFQVESKLIYVILSSVALGALLLFLLIAFFPPWSRDQGQQALPPTAKPTRKMAQIQTALQLGDWRKALDLLSTVYETDPEYWQARKIKGDLLLEKGQWNEAFQEYREALNHCTGQEHALVQLCLGNVFEQQDQIDQARDQFLQVLNASPQSMEAVQRLRNLAVREQDWNEAMTWQETKEQLELEETETQQESNWKMGIRYELARTASDLGNYKTSQALLKYIFRMTDYFTPAFLLQGEIQEKQQNPGGGLKTYEQGFARTQNPAILKKIGESFLIQNQPERAIAFFREVVRNHPKDPRAAFCLGDLYRKLEMMAEAMKVFEMVREKHPDWLLNNIVLAELYDRDGQKEKALHLYKGIVDNSEALSVQPWQCYSCNTTYADYREFCVVCFEWNSVNLNQNKAGTTDFGYEKSTALLL